MHFSFLFLDRRCKGDFIAVANSFLTVSLCPLVLSLFVIYIKTKTSILGIHKGCPTFAETGKIRRCEKPDFPWL